MKKLKSKIDELQLKHERSLMKVSSELNEDPISIVSSTDQCTILPFMNFSWEEQQKYLKSSSKGIRYHPMIIRYSFSLASKLAAAYDEIRYDANKGTRFAILPSRRRLCDYKKFVVILMEKMKIQEKLV